MLNKPYNTAPPNDSTVMVSPYKGLNIKNAGLLDCVAWGQLWLTQ